MSHALLAEVAATLLMALAVACAPAAPEPVVSTPPVVPVDAVAADDGAGGSAEPVAIEAPPEKPASPIDWRDDMETAVEDARRAGRPALLYFHADWSVAALQLDRELWAQPVVRHAMRGVDAIRIDVTANDETAEARVRRYFALSIPTLIVLNRIGHEHRRFAGRPSAAELVAALAAVR